MMKAYLLRKWEGLKNSVSNFILGKYDGLKNKVAETKLALKNQYQLVKTQTLNYLNQKNTALKSKCRNFKNRTVNYLRSKHNAFMDLMLIKGIKNSLKAGFFISKVILKVGNLLLDLIERFAIKLPLKVGYHSLRNILKVIKQILKLAYRNPLTFGSTMAITHMMARLRTPMYMTVLHSVNDPILTNLLIECGFLLPMLGLSYSYRGIKALRQAYLNRKNALPVERMISEGNGRDDNAPAAPQAPVSSLQLNSALSSAPLPPFNPEFIEKVSNGNRDGIVENTLVASELVVPQLPYNPVYLALHEANQNAEMIQAEAPKPIVMPEPAQLGVPAAPVAIMSNASSDKAMPKKRSRSEDVETAEEASPARTPVYKRSRDESENGSPDAKRSRV